MLLLVYIKYIKYVYQYKDIVKSIIRRAASYYSNEYYVYWRSLVLSAPSQQLASNTKYSTGIISAYELRPQSRKKVRQRRRHARRLALYFQLYFFPLQLQFQVIKYTNSTYYIFILFFPTVYSIITLFFLRSFTRNST